MFGHFNTELLMSGHKKEKLTLMKEKSTIWIWI